MTVDNKVKQTDIYRKRIIVRRGMQINKLDEGHNENKIHNGKTVRLHLKCRRG